jgi:ABC-2 type transport system permease protein
VRKTLVIASREYLAAVRTKSFIISVILLPIMMSGGIIAQKLSQKIGDTSTKRVAVIDHTPGQIVYAAIAKAVQHHNEHEIFEEAQPGGRQVKPKFALEKIDPPPEGDQAAADRLRLELSDRVRKGELLAFVEVGADLLKPSTAPATASSGVDHDDFAIRYSTNRPTYVDFKMMLNSAVPQAVFAKRMEAAGLSYQRIRPLLFPPPVEDRGLAERTTSGSVHYQSSQNQIASFAIPLVLLILMFIVTIVGASPMTANVIEEKQLRIAEVLLGSVRPFELMMGKLLGGVGVALTLAIIYFGGAYYVAVTQGMASSISTASILWFLFFTVLGTMMYGSMFVAAGAAVTNVKEAQSMIMPVMLLIMLPMFVLGNIIQDPSGKLATVVSFLPFSAPMVMTARVSIPPGVPVWQALLAAGIALMTTVALIWAAGRIFRVGILMQGQGAKITELARWVVRG